MAKSVLPYGFERDSGHALLAPFETGSTVGVSLRMDYDRLSDHAGVLVRVDERTWIKAGVEISDGARQLAAVVTIEGRSNCPWRRSPNGRA